MTTRTEELALKRRTLLLHCALQRLEITHQLIGIEAKLTRADRVAEIITSSARNPLLLIAMVAGTALIGPWRLLRWVSQGAMFFNIARRLHGLFVR